MKKTLLIAGGTLIALVAILALPVLFWLGPAMKSTIESIGSKIVGAPITVKTLRIYPVSGTVHLTGLVIGNPKGFSSKNALAVKNLNVDIAMTSLLSDTVVIKEILIEAPAFMYERTIRADNISKIRSNIKAYGSKEEEPETEKPPGKKVIIERFVLRNGRVTAKLSALPAASVSLPDLERTNIGKNTGGGTWSTAIGEITSIIEGTIGDAVSGLANTAGGLVKDVGDSAVGAGKSLGNTAVDTVKDIGGLFRKKE